jgi:hypothetical protein
MEGSTMKDTVTRYVPTYVNAEGMRTLMLPMQGRYTYDAPELAQRWIDAIRLRNTPDRIAQIWGGADTFEVRPVECYPVHFDPTTCYFD